MISIDLRESPDPLIGKRQRQINGEYLPFRLIWEVVDPSSIEKGRIARPGNTIFTKETLDAICARLAKIPSFNIVARLSGEPLLHPGIHNIIQALENLWPNARLILETCGSLPLEAYLRILKKFEGRTLELALRSRGKQLALRDIAALAGVIVDTGHILTLHELDADFDSSAQIFMKALNKKWPGNILYFEGASQAGLSSVTPDSMADSQYISLDHCPLAHNSIRISSDGTLFEGICEKGMRCGPLWQLPEDALARTLRLSCSETNCEYMSGPFRELNGPRPLCGSASEIFPASGSIDESSLNWNPQWGLPQISSQFLINDREVAETDSLAVLVYARNNETTIAGCLDSIFLQRINKLQVIAIDDGSNDTTRDILERYRGLYPSRLHILHYPQYAGRLEAIQKSRQFFWARRVVFWDAMRLMPPSCLPQCLDGEDPSKEVSNEWNAHETINVTRQIKLPHEPGKGQYVPYLKPLNLMAPAFGYTIVFTLFDGGTPLDEPLEIPLIDNTQIMILVAGEIPDWLKDLSEYRPDVYVFAAPAQSPSLELAAELAARHAIGSHILFAPAFPSSAESMRLAFANSPALIAKEDKTKSAAEIFKDAHLHGTNLPELLRKLDIGLKGSCFPKALLAKIFALKDIQFDETLLFLICASQSDSLTFIPEAVQTAVGATANDVTKIDIFGLSLPYFVYNLDNKSSIPLWERSYKEFYCRCSMRPSMPDKARSQAEFRDPLVSILIPAYNMAEYIDRCINSVLLQNYRNWEIIFIDDASTDRTAAICSAYAELYNNIHLFINEENRGQGYSRNLALNLAKGKYIVYLDSDDILLDNFLLTAVSLMENHEELDYAQFSFVRRYIGNEYNIVNQAFRGFADAKSCAEIYSLYCKGKLSANAAWGKIIRKSFLIDNSIRFSESMGEDNLFLLMFYKSAKNAIFVDWPGYALNDTPHEASTRIYPRLTWRHISGLYSTMLALEVFFAADRSDFARGAMRDKFATFIDWDVNSRAWYFIMAERNGIPFLPDSWAALLGDCPMFMTCLFREYAIRRKPQFQMRPAVALQADSAPIPEIYIKNAMDSDWEPKISIICAGDNLDILIEENAEVLETARGLEYEIILIEKASGDLKAMAACRRFSLSRPNASLYRAGSQHNDFSLRNFGASIASGKFLCFLCGVEPMPAGCLGALSEALSKEPDANVLAFVSDGTAGALCGKPPIHGDAEVEPRRAIVEHLANSERPYSWQNLIVKREFFEIYDLGFSLTDIGQEEYALKAIKNSGSLRLVPVARKSTSFSSLVFSFLANMPPEEVASICFTILRELKGLCGSTLAESSPQDIQRMFSGFFFGPYIGAIINIAASLQYEELLAEPWHGLFRDLFSIPEMPRLLLLEYARQICSPAKGKE